MYSIREQFDPIVGEMQEPGVIKFFSIQSHLDKTWWHFLRQVGGKDPATGEFHRVPLPDSKQLIKQYLQKKDYYFDLQMTRQQQEVTAMDIDTPYKPFQPEAKT